MTFPLPQRLQEHFPYHLTFFSWSLEGNQDAPVGRTSWEGWQAESWTPYLIGPKRAPVVVHLLQLRFHLATQRGRARNY